MPPCTPSSPGATRPDRRGAAPVAPAGRRTTVRAMARPVIGICTALERARWSVSDQQAFLLPRSYIAAVQRAGGLALMLPPDECAREEPDEVLDLLDALILAGGADIDPAAYGETAHSETRGTV